MSELEDLFSNSSSGVTHLHSKSSWHNLWQLHNRQEKNRGSFSHQTWTAIMRRLTQAYLHHILQVNPHPQIIMWMAHQCRPLMISHWWGNIIIMQHIRWAQCTPFYQTTCQTWQVDQHKAGTSIQGAHHYRLLRPLCVVIFIRYWGLVRRYWLLISNQSPEEVQLPSWPT